MAKLSQRKSLKNNNKKNRRRVFELSTLFLATKVRIVRFNDMMSIVRFIILFFVSSNSVQAQNCDSCEIFVHNTLTPDCDLFECEFLKIESNCAINEFELSIFNRWGEQLFYSDKLSQKFDSSEVKDGTYFWMISGAFCENQKFKRNGYLYVLR